MLQLIAPVAFVATLFFPQSYPTATAPLVAATAVDRASSLEIYQLAVRGSSRDAAPQSMTLIIHPEGKGFTGYVLSDAHAVALDSVAIEGDVLTATVQTTSGPAELTLTASATGVQGTLTVHAHTLKVSGERTL